MVIHQYSKSFTLIELLITLGILGVLMAVVVITINPAEFLKQSRDTKRMSDISNLQTAINLYLFEGSSLGTPGVTYISIPAANSDCSDLNLPAGSWHCATSDNYLKVDGTGWLPLNFSALTISSPLSVLPVDPQNSVSESYYTYSTDGSGFVITAVPESNKYRNNSDLLTGFVASGASDKLVGGNFPNGWVFVPGDPNFKTPGFWVMKYEAKCVSGNTPLTSPDTGYHTYNNSSQPCAGDRYIASTSEGYPITNISHNTAKAYCQSIGAHLLTNDEYMTIVRNAEQVPVNWSNNQVGNGVLPRGNSNSAAAQDGSSIYGTGYTDHTHLRTLTLSNGSVIWDIAGNVYDHVQRSNDNAGDLTNTMVLPACSDAQAAWGWCKYASTESPYVSSWTNDVAKDKVAPSNTSWTSSQNIGQVYTYKNGTNQGTTVFLRGGGWGIGAYGGPFALSLVWGTDRTSYDGGFRCAR